MTEEERLINFIRTELHVSEWARKHIRGQIKNPSNNVLAISSVIFRRQNNGKKAT